MFSSLAEPLLSRRSTVAALLLNKHLHINGMTRGSVKITDDAPSNADAAAGGGAGAGGAKAAAKPPATIARDSSSTHSNGVTAHESCPDGPPHPPPPSVAARIDMPNSDDSTPTPSPGSTPVAKRGKAGVKRRFLGVGVRKSSAGVGPDAIMGAAATGEAKKKQASLHKMKRERKVGRGRGRGG